MYLRIIYIKVTLILTFFDDCRKLFMTLKLIRHFHVQMSSKIINYEHLQNV